jgi:hypothetical protein
LYGELSDHLYELPPCTPQTTVSFEDIQMKDKVNTTEEYFVGTYVDSIYRRGTNTVRFQPLAGFTNTGTIQAILYNNKKRISTKNCC